MNGTQGIQLNPGQFVTGRRQLSEATGIGESKVYRLIELLKSEQQIEQQVYSKYSIITIVNWSSYQESEQQIEQQVNSKRTASEQQVNTKQEVKEVKNGEKEPNSSDLPFICKTVRESLHKIQLSARDMEIIRAWLSLFTTEEIDAACAATKAKGGASVGYIDTVLRGGRDTPKPEEKRYMSVEEEQMWIKAARAQGVDI